MATTGAWLAADNLSAAIDGHLLQRATRVTPNLPEAATLLGIDEQSDPDKLQMARALRQRSAQAVLI